MKKKGRTRRKKGLLPRPALLGGGAAAAGLLVVAIMLSYGGAGSADAGLNQPVQPVQGQNQDHSAAEPAITDTATDEMPQPAEEVPAPADMPSPATQQVTQIHFTDGNFTVLAAGPDKFSNSTVAVTGKVYDIVDQSTSGQTLLTYRMHDKAVESDESKAAVMFQQVKRSGIVAPVIQVDDCISVLGSVRGGISDADAFGSQIRIPVIDTQSISRIECVDSAMPAIETMQDNASQSFAGVTITVERVQLADSHVRIKASIRNVEGGDGVFVRDRESFVEYSGMQYPSITHQTAFVNYRIQQEMLAKSENTGYLFFEPIEDYDGGQLVLHIVMEKAGISGSGKFTFIVRV